MGCAYRIRYGARKKDKLLTFAVEMKHGEKKKKTEISKGSVSFSQYEAGSGSVPHDVMLGKGQILKIEVYTGGEDQGIVTPPSDRVESTENFPKNSEKSHRHSLYHITPPKFGDDPDEKSSEKNAERKHQDNATHLSSVKNKNRHATVIPKEEVGKYLPDSDSLNSKNEVSHLKENSRGAETPGKTDSTRELSTRDSMRDLSARVAKTLSVKDIKIPISSAQGQKITDHPAKKGKTPRLNTSEGSETEEKKDEEKKTSVGVERTKTNRHSHRLSHNDDESSKLKKRIEALKIEAEEAKSKLGKTEEELEKLKENSEKDLQEKEIEIKKLKIEANMRLQSHMTQSLGFAKFQQENIALQEEIEKLRGGAGEKDGKSEEIKNSELKNAKLLEEKVKELEGEKELLKMEITKKNSEISETSENFKKNQQELQEKNHQLKDLSSQLEKSLEDAEHSRIELGRISSQLSEQNNHSDKEGILKIEISKKDKEIATLKVELLEKNTNLRELSSQLEEAFSSAEMYRIELDKIERN